MSDIILSIDGLTVRYPLSKTLFGPAEYLTALRGLSLQIPRGSMFGLVGESGCGKTTLGRACLQATPISSGKVTLTSRGGEQFQIGSLAGKQQKRFRHVAQMIFQDPYAALNPRMTVRDIIAEPLEVMKLTKSRAETDAKVQEIAGKCRLNIEHLRRFPHAFSGGQRQRISIARALVTEPEFIVADESVAALDVSIQADILNLLKELQQDMGLTILFISHDLSVVAHICDQVAVMYLGEIVEQAPPQKLFTAPQHPYSRALLSAIPSLDPDETADIDLLEGEIPSPANPPSGCKFHTRCRFQQSHCQQTVPPLSEITLDHQVACFEQGKLGETITR